jgi:hypothetical protein
MTLGTDLTNLDEIYDDFIKEYELGNFIEGVCNWNGDDALMGPKSLGKRFAEYCKRVGHKKEDYIGYQTELEDWVDIHLGNLESKFR